MRKTWSSNLIVYALMTNQKSEYFSTLFLVVKEPKRTRIRIRAGANFTNVYYTFDPFLYHN